MPLSQKLRLIHLQADSIGRYWKPKLSRFEACAKGSLLILAPCLMTCQPSQVPTSAFIILMDWRKRSVISAILRSVEITDRETEISENEFYGCTNLKNIKMGNDVTKIGNRAFSDCSSLESFIVGPKVNSIGQGAFSGCEGMTTLVSRNTEPPVCESQALNGINK